MSVFVVVVSTDFSVFITPYVIALCRCNTLTCRTTCVSCVHDKLEKN